LTPTQASYLRGKRYNLEKRQGQRNDLTSGKNYQKSQELAQQFGVSEKTIRNDDQFTKAVDSLFYDIKKAALKGEINKQDVIQQ